MGRQVGAHDPYMMDAHNIRPKNQHSKRKLQILGSSGTTRDMPLIDTIGAGPMTEIMVDGALMEINARQVGAHDPYMMDAHNIRPKNQHSYDGRDPLQRRLLEESEILDNEEKKGEKEATATADLKNLQEEKKKTPKEKEKLKKKIAKVMKGKKICFLQQKIRLLTIRSLSKVYQVRPLKTYIYSNNSLCNNKTNNTPHIMVNK